MAKGKSKLNKKFAVVSAAVVASALAGAAVLYKTSRHANPQQFIAAGDAAIRQNDFLTAKDNYERAVGLLPMNADLHLKLGKTYYQLKSLGGDNFWSSINEFTRAQVLEPNSKEAWGALLMANEFYVTARENAPTTSRDREKLPESFTMARNAAERLGKLDPNNVEAQVAVSSLKIRAWLMKLAIPVTADEKDKNKTDDQKVDDAIAALTKLSSDHPENEMIPYWIARAKINQAVNLMQATPNAPEIAPLFAEAAAEFDSAISVRPKDIGLYLKKADILLSLQRTDPTANSVEYGKQVRAALDSAQSLADIQNPEEYQSAKSQWANYLSVTDSARAEEVYRDLITRFSAMPQYQIQALRFRFQLANLLRRDFSRHADSLALLDAIPSIPPASLIGYDQQQAWSNSVSQAKLLRAVIQTDELERRPSGKMRDGLIADVTASLDAAKSRLDGTVPFLMATGEFQLAIGKVRDAIQTMTLAADKAAELPGGVSTELLRKEANVYVRGQQPGKAIELLEKVMKQDPQMANSAELHATLANLHIQNKDPDHAKPYVDWLALRAPDDAGVIILEMQVLGNNPDPAKLRALYDKLPEKTPAEIDSKSRVAEGLLRSRPERERLLMVQHKADPGNVQVAGGLIQLLVADSKAAEAQGVLDDLKAAKPAEPAVPVLADLIKGVSPEAMIDSEVGAIGKISDPTLRERKFAELYAANGQPEEEMKHLKLALASSPNDNVVLQTIFQRYLTARQFTDAEAMLPHMAELDLDDAKGLMFRSKLYLAKGEIASAIVSSRQLTHDYPEFSGSWEIYGDALSFGGQPETACQQYITALDKQATNIEATRGLIKCSVQQGKLDDARRYIYNARQRFPDDLVYREMEVQFEILYGKPETIVPSLTQSITDHPDVKRNYAITVQALLASSRSAAGGGDSKGASDYLARAQKLLKQAIDKWPDDLSFAQSLADASLQSNDLSGAEAPLRAIAARPRWKNQPAPLLMLAKVYLSAKKFDLAEPLLKQTLTLDPSLVEPRMLLADCLIADRQYEDALGTIKPAIDNYPVLEKYVNLLLALSRGSEAEGIVATALGKDEKSQLLTNLLINIYQSEHKTEMALDRVNKALLADPTNLGAYLLRGELEASGVNADLEAAKKDLRVYIDGMPTDPRGRMLMAEVLDASHDQDGAINELQVAVRYSNLDRQPRLLLLREYLQANPPRTEQLDGLLKETLAIPQFQHDPQFQMAGARVWAQEGDTDKALAAVRDAMAHVQDKSALLNDYLSILLMAKQYPLLLDESKGYAADPKTSWSVFSFRGQAKAATGDKDGAAAEFQTALDRAGTEKSATPARTVSQAISKNLGIDTALKMIAPRAKNSDKWTLVSIDLYQAAKRMPEATAACESAMASLDALEPQDQYYVLESMASLYIRETPPQAEKAMAMYRKLVERNPGDANAMNNIASVLSDMTVPPRPQEAREWSTKAYNICKQANLIIPAIYDTHGWILIQCDQMDEGIQVLHDAIEKSDFPDAHYHLAMGYLKLKHPEAAQRELQSALQMINTPSKNFTIIDPDLKKKIDAALREAAQLLQVK